MTLSFAITLVLRYLLAVLFLPFSALDKILNFNGATAQAREVIPSDGAARLTIVAALCIEIIMPLGILTGVADRLAALIMAGYQVAPGALYHLNQRNLEVLDHSSVDFNHLRRRHVGDIIGGARHVHA